MLSVPPASVESPTTVKSATAMESIKARASARRKSSDVSAMVKSTKCSGAHACLPVLCSKAARRTMIERRAVARCAAVEAKKRISQAPLSRRLQVDDAAFQPNGDGVGPVARTYFGKNIFTLALHDFFLSPDPAGT